MKNKYIVIKCLVLSIALFIVGCSSQSETMTINQAYTKGLLYLNNNNIEKAKESFAIAADNGNTKAQAILASLILDKKNSITDEELNRSYQLLQESLKSDEPLAYLGMYYYYRNQNDTKLSNQWLDKAVNKNISIANYQKAQLLFEKNTNDANGIKLLEKAAIQNYTPAQALLLSRSITFNNKVDSYVWSSIIKKKVSSSKDIYKASSALRDRMVKELTEKQKIDADNKIASILDQMAEQKSNLL